MTHNISQKKMNKYLKRKEETGKGDHCSSGQGHQKMVGSLRAVGRERAAGSQESLEAGNAKEPTLQDGAQKAVPAERQLDLQRQKEKMKAKQKQIPGSVKT